MFMVVIDVRTPPVHLTADPLLILAGAAVLFL
jgi:hypothetical protein